MNQRTRLPTPGSDRYRYARYRQRLALAAALSLLAHALLLSLRFGLPGLGLPGLELPWNQRRAQPVGLSVVLSNVRREPDNASDAETAPAVLASALPAAPVPSAERTQAQEAALPAHASAPSRLLAVPARKRRAPMAPARAGAVHPHSVPAAPPPAKRPQPSRAASGPRLITQDDMGQKSFAVPLPVFDEPERTAASDTGALPELAQSAAPDPQVQPEPEDRSASEREQMRVAQALAEQQAQLAREVEARKQEEQRAAQELDARRQAEALAQQEKLRQEEQENARRAQELEARRLELQRQQDEARRQAEETAQQQSAALALQKQAEQRRLEEESARLARESEAKRREELRLQEEARVRALEQEARRQEQEAALRRRQADELAARERAAAQAAQARQQDLALAEAGRSAAAMARNSAGGSLASRALEMARKADDLPMGTSLPPMPAQTAAPARRRSVLGRIDNDVGLQMYVESWRLKIERNGRLNYKQALIESAYTEPIVTVAVRSDGSIEDILFHRSSGRPELDEAVRRIVRLNARYAAFPPELARRYDVIEIRRLWSFDEKLRLMEEVR